MQTTFTAEQLEDPRHRRGRTGSCAKCVHCGFCTATCPTYVLLGDELDSPRGRIYLIKNMLEKGEPATAETVKHIDRCLSCLSCMTTCPSGVNYMHLVDDARAHVEETYQAPIVRKDVARAACLRHAATRPLPPGADRGEARAGRSRRCSARRLKRVEAMLALAPKHVPAPKPSADRRNLSGRGAKRGRVALLWAASKACSTRRSTRRRSGFSTAWCRSRGLRGRSLLRLADPSHGPREGRARQRRDAIDAWTARSAAQVDAVIVTASGCGTTIKDYGHMLRLDPLMPEKASEIQRWPTTSPNISRSLDLPSGRRRSSHASPIIPPARCSTARRSRP